MRKYGERYRPKHQSYLCAHTNPTVGRPRHSHSEGYPAHTVTLRRVPVKMRQFFALPHGGRSAGDLLRFVTRPD